MLLSRENLNDCIYLAYDNSDEKYLFEIICDLINDRARVIDTTK